MFIGLNEHSGFFLFMGCYLFQGTFVFPYIYIHSSILLIDKYSANCYIEISRRLDGAYAIDEVEDVQTAKTNEKNKLEDAIDKANKELVNIEDELLSVPQKIADLSLSRSEAAQRCKSVQEALDAYYAIEAQIKEICSEFNLNFAMRFTNHIPL